MKGYIFALDDKRDVQRYFRLGLFGVRQFSGGTQNDIGRFAPDTSPSKNVFFETIADYLTIAPGDKIFFFVKRMIYGIGEVIAPPEAERNPVRLNYPRSLSFNPDYLQSSGSALIGPNEDDHWYGIRAVVPFIPNPRFYDKGIDMDEILSNPKASASSGLRFWSGTSFKQLGSDETSLLMEVFARRFYGDGNGTFEGPDPNELAEQLLQAHGPASLASEVQGDSRLYFDPDNGMALVESLLHGLLVEHIGTLNSEWSKHLCPPDNVDVFHELSASPPKPPRWGDKMDIVSTREIEHVSRPAADWRTDRIEGIPVHYDLTEIKKGSLERLRRNSAVSMLSGELSQLMRYADFIAANYAGGNYDAVSANFVVHKVSDNVKEIFLEAVHGTGDVSDVISRSFILDPREKPATHVWRDVNLLEYQWNHALGILELEPIC